MSRVPAHPSSTVVLMRDAEAGIEILYLRRNSRLDFHGGAWVFPGGRIDPGDEASGAADPLHASRAAAAREAREEAGLAVEPASLVPFARWTTPVGVPKRFETWFFLARGDDQPVEVDGGEIHEHRWLTPAAALAARDAGEIELPPPTFVTTTLLSGFARADDALDAVAPEPPRIYLPRVQRVDGGLCSLYGGDAAYAGGEVDRVGPRHRLWMLESGWRYERALEPEVPRHSAAVRLARAEDLAALPGIEYAADRRFAEIGMPEVTEAELFDRRELGEALADGWLWVATDEADAPVGFALGERLDENAHLEELSVHPDHGRRGLGRAMLAALVDRARREGLPAVTLTTYRDVPWNGPFYARLGFRPLADGEIGPELRARIRHEDEEGLPSALRLAMRLRL